MSEPIQVGANGAEEEVPSFLAGVKAGTIDKTSAEDMIWGGNEAVSLHSGTAFDELLAWAVSRDVSDITVQTREPVWCERYGIMYPVTRRVLESTEVQELVNKLYGSDNGYGEVLSGKDRDFAYQVRITRAERLRFRVNVTACDSPGGGQAGMQITMRSLPSVPPRMDMLGIEQPIIDNFAPRQGIVLITGPTGSGKTTLLASGIRSLLEKPDGYHRIVTFEAPIEFVYHHIKKPTSVIAQSEIPKHIGSFSAGVRGAMRRRPTVILVGESRDAETMGASSEAALTGHLVFSTVHSNGVPETVRRIVATFPPEERQSRSVDIMEALRMIVTQSLLRTVDGRRVACREYLIFDEEVREILLEHHPDEWGPITRRLVRERGQTMESAVQKQLEIGRIDKVEASSFLRRQAAINRAMDQEVSQARAQEAGGMAATAAVAATVALELAAEEGGESLGQHSGVPMAAAAAAAAAVSAVTNSSH